VKFPPDLDLAVLSAGALLVIAAVALFVMIFI